MAYPTDDELERELDVWLRQGFIEIARTQLRLRLLCAMQCLLSTIRQSSHQLDLLSLWSRVVYVVEAQRTEVAAMQRILETLEQSELS